MFVIEKIPMAMTVHQNYLKTIFKIKFRIVSLTKMKVAIRRESTTTITELSRSSIRDGQCTFDISFLTSPTYLIALFITFHSCEMQVWRDSNPQPPVLETGALAN
jgi:hypothetical protein